MNDFDVESELYAAMAAETEGLGPPELDMDRVHAAARRRRTVLSGSGAAVALVGATVVAVAFGGSGRSSASHGSPADGVLPSVQLSVSLDPSGCDRILQVIPPFFTGTSRRPPSPPAKPVPPQGGCRVLMELPPYQRTAPVSPPSG